MSNVKPLYFLSVTCLHSVVFVSSVTSTRQGKKSQAQLASRKNLFFFSFVVRKTQLKISETSYNAFTNSYKKFKIYL